MKIKHTSCCEALRQKPEQAFAKGKEVKPMKGHECFWKLMVEKPKPHRALNKSVELTHGDKHKSIVLSAIHFKRAYPRNELR